jgi:hypothetical protein
LEDFVEVRSRPWLVEGVEDKGQGLLALKLSAFPTTSKASPLKLPGMPKSAHGVYPTMSGRG